MNDAPFFSVCVPCFNHGGYVGETIRSVLRQDFADFEIVVSDNTSTDNSRDVVRACSDPRIKLLENRYNIGFAPNLQRVTAAARGRFIILLSSDDLMRPGALRRYADIFIQQGVRAEQTVITSACNVIDERGDVAGVKYKSSESPRIIETPADRAQVVLFDGAVQTNKGLEVLRRALLEVFSTAVFCTTAYPRTLWEQVEGYDTTYQYMPDTAFLHKLLALDPDFVYVHEPLFAYRVHRGGQIAQAAAVGALRQQVDAYTRTVNFPAALLDKLGITRDEIVRGFLDEFCLTESLRSVRAGSWLRALKLFCFAFATYPKAALRRPRTYLAAMALLAGPLGRITVRRTASLITRGSSASSRPARPSQPQLTTSA